MKFLMLAMAFTLIASGASAAILASDDFTYDDGLLVPNGGWTHHSGNDDLMVVSGEAVVEHGTPSEDAHIVFTPTTNATVYFEFDFSVDDLGAPYVGTDNEYFAHFMPETGFNYRARMRVNPPTGVGDYTVGISTQASSTTDAVWATDLTFDVDYHVIVAYNQVANTTVLWIDATSYTDASILGADEDDLDAEFSGRFALRQSDSSENETIRVDNLVISDTCEDVFSSDCPTVANESQSWGELKSLYR
ncbi:hypothetical protein H8E07_01675 [bacterium]|nr:hypothetical protein [bacterium]